LQGIQKLSCHATLVVTHGEAVRAAVAMYEPSAVVYEVNHTAYAPLRRLGEKGKWSLACESDATGIKWYLEQSDATE
jgi:hypothetical protein